MKKRTMGQTLRLIALLSATAALLPFLLAAEGTPTSWESVGKVFGKEGTLLPGDVYRIGLPRTDLKVTREGTTVEPALALGSWAAFKKTGQGEAALMMGDLVLLAPEVGPVMKRLLDGGIQVTALHNHLIGENPRLMYLHYEAEGGAAAIAEKLKEALLLSATPLNATAARRSPPLSTDQTNMFKLVQQILGHEGSMAGRVLQVSVPFPEPVRCHGIEIPPAMGTATALNFQIAGTGVATAGDFALEDDDLGPAVIALRGGGIEVTAIHHHMLHDDPSLKFVHFWGVGPAEKIAHTLRSVLELIGDKT